MSSWGKWILAAGIAGLGAHVHAKPAAQHNKKQTRQVVMRVNTRTHVIEVKTQRGWIPTRQVTSEQDEPGQVTVEQTGYWGYRGWYGGGWGTGWGGGYYNNWYPNYAYGYGSYPYSSYSSTPEYEGYYHSGISTSYWNAYPSSYYFYTPTWTLYYGRTAYDPVNWFFSGLYNYYYYNL